MLSVSRRACIVDKQASSALFRVAAASRRISLPASLGTAKLHNCNSLACRASSPGLVDGPSTTIEKSTSKVWKQSPTYKVLLHNDGHNRRETVVKVLIKVIPAMTIDTALVCMQEAHETGVAMVISCPQDDAEGYCEALRLNGLTSTIEA